MIAQENNEGNESLVKLPILRTGLIDYVGLVTNKQTNAVVSSTSG